MIDYFFKKKVASSRGTPQENDAKFRFAIHPQGIRQFHDNCKIAKCQTVATFNFSANLTLKDSPDYLRLSLDKHCCSYMLMIN